MKHVIILFICFLSSLCIVLYEDKGDVLERNEDSYYVFKEYSENDENVVNPETDDLELKANIVIIFYSILFSALFYLKMRSTNRYTLQ